MHENNGKQVGKEYHKHRKTNDRYKPEWNNI